MNISDLLIKRPTTRKSIVLRFIAGITLVYFLRIVQVSFLLTGDIINGVYWVSGSGGSLIPIPTEPGLLTVLEHANLMDSLIYGIFISNGMWIIFSVILVLYIMSPVTISTKRKIP